MKTKREKFKEEFYAKMVKKYNYRVIQQKCSDEGKIKDYIRWRNGGYYPDLDRLVVEHMYKVGDPDAAWIDAHIERSERQLLFGDSQILPTIEGMP